MIYIVIALINGVLIAMSRGLNGRLASSRGAFFTSWINHLVGFGFLTIVLLASQGLFAQLGTVPWYAFLGGSLGALFVALNSFVLVRLGTTQSTLLIITGQLAISLLIDLWFGKITLGYDLISLKLIGGCLLLVLGFYASVARPAQKRS
ncbi:MAG: transporter family-2 protein [Reinekea sp.]